MVPVVKRKFFIFMLSDFIAEYRTPKRGQSAKVYDAVHFEEHANDVIAYVITLLQMGVPLENIGTSCIECCAIQ